MRRTALLILMSVLACLLFADMAAAADIGFMGIGGRLGYVKPEDPIDGTFDIGVVVDLGTIIPALNSKSDTFFSATDSIIFKSTISYCWC